MTRRIELSVLEYLKRMVAGSLLPEHHTHMRYPTPISTTLGFEVTAVGEGAATIRATADPTRFGNQQGTVHGGFLTELADAAIGTACSTLMDRETTFTSVDLQASFLRPVWDDELIARAHATHRGRTLSRWHCEVIRESDGRTVMTANSTMMFLRGERAHGR